MPGGPLPAMGKGWCPGGAAGGGPAPGMPVGGRKCGGCEPRGGATPAAWGTMRGAPCCCVAAPLAGGTRNGARDV